MKRILPIALLSFLIMSLSGVAASLTTAFTYQGRLNDGGQAANGSYDFHFLLYDAETGGNQVGNPVTNQNVNVNNGSFTTTLDFGSAAFPGSDRWVEFGVRPVGGGVFTLVGPRQKLTPTPYAITAGNLATDATPVFTGAPAFNASGGPPFSVAGSTKVPNLNADFLDGLDSASFVLKAGDTMAGNLTIANPGTLNFGNNVRQMLNLWDVQYGIGVQANTLYYRSHNNFAWYKDGAHADAGYDPGAGGKVLMTLGANGNLAVAASTGVAVEGDAGIFAGGVGVRGLSGGGLTVGVFGWATNGTLAAGVSGRADGTNSIGVLAQADNGSAAYGVLSRSIGGYAGRFDGSVWIEFSSPPSKPQLYLHEPSDTGFDRLRMQTGSNPYWDIAVGTQPFVDATNSLRFFSSGPGNGDVMTLSPEGHLHVRVLTIEGGADVAEPFLMSEKNLCKGAVVVIDAANPGRLKLSTAAYDTRVAGVISGAGGVNPGVSLNQRGLMEGDQSVALSGRVYVQADASFGAIQPGELLTTSDTPGHAMKVTDRARAQGAILGKAMTGLTEGQGLVLVLVTLQ